MGRRGPAPQPESLKLLRGNPGKRPLKKRGATLPVLLRELDDQCPNGRQRHRTPDWVGQITERLAQQVIPGFKETWAQLGAVDMVLAEVEDEFGEDPLLPELRGRLGRMREELAGLHKEMESLLEGFHLPEPLDLPEPSEHEVSWLRSVVERAVERATKAS